MEVNQPDCIPRSEFVSPPNDLDVESFLANEKILVEFGAVSPLLNNLHLSSQPNLDALAANTENIADSAKRTRKVRRPFKRINRKDVILGNNKFGRRGKLRCGLCRLQHSPCVFISVHDACDRCRKGKAGEPCVKTWGPVKQRRSSTMLPQISLFEVIEIPNFSPDREPETDPTDNDNPGFDANALSKVEYICPSSSPENSRPLSLYDETIDPFDLGVLQHEYDQNPLNTSHGWLSRYFVRFIASQYGKSIHSPHLRIATVLFVASMNSCQPCGGETHLIMIRRDRLIKSLRFRLNQPDNLDESDLFAAFLYTLHLCRCHSNEWTTAMRACCAIIRYLSRRSVSNHSRLVFDIFVPMVVDHFAFWCHTNNFRKDLPVDIYRALPQAMRTEECAQRYYRILNFSWSPVTRAEWLMASRLTRFLDLAEGLNLKRNGSLEQFHLQNLHYSYLSDLDGFQPFPEYFQRWLAKLTSDPYCGCMLKFILDTFSDLLLGALWQSQNGTDMSSGVDGRQEGFLAFLRRVWIFEQCLNWLDGNLITWAGFEMDPNLYELIEKTLKSNSILNGIEFLSQLKERAFSECRKLCDLAFEGIKVAMEDLLDVFPMLQVKEERGWLLEYLVDLLDLSCDFPRPLPVGDAKSSIVDLDNLIMY